MNPQVRYIYDARTGKGRYEDVGRFELALIDFVVGLIRAIQWINDWLED